jgi:hypothetical protein
VTLTVARPLAVRPAPVQVTVYVAVVSEPTGIEPLTPVASAVPCGLMTWQDAALVLFHETTLP